MERIASELCSVLSRWDGVEAIILGEAAEAGLLDPYFHIQVDVHHWGSLPPAGERRQRLHDPPAFESLTASAEDHFLAEELPVRIRYRELSWYDLILRRIEERLWVPHESGTNIFYRITRGQVLFQKTEWLDRLRERLERLPDSFWTDIVESTRTAAERLLRDLSAAVYRNDPLFYLLSSAGFVRNLCGFLFAFNRRFEPSGRTMYERVLELPELPEGFQGRFESFLRHEQELSPERKREIAELLTRSILIMR